MCNRRVRCLRNSGWGFSFVALEFINDARLPIRLTLVRFPQVQITNETRPSKLQSFFFCFNNSHLFSYSKHTFQKSWILSKQNSSKKLWFPCFNQIYTFYFHGIGILFFFFVCWHYPRLQQTFAESVICFAASKIWKYVFTQLASHNKNLTAPPKGHTVLESYFRNLHKNKLVR
jgi:hypothetical protein